MPRVLRKQNASRNAIQWILLMTILVGVSACGVNTASGSPDYAPCMPEGEGVNIYNAEVSSESEAILDQYMGIAGIVPTLAPSANGETFIGSISEAQALLTMNSVPSQGAFLFLFEETFRASDIKTIKFDNFDEITIIITFLSPKLLQAAFLNDFIYHNELSTDFESKMFSAIAKTVQRQELLFLVTVTGIHRESLSSTHSVTIPIKQLLLTNASDLYIRPAHDEHNLTQTYYTNQDPESGILGYPIGVMINNQCIWVLDPIYNTNIVIGIDALKVDNVDNGPHTWSIPYTSLLKSDSSSPPSAFNTGGISMPTKIEPHSSPPQDRNAVTFWSDYALFVWYKVTQGNR